MQLPTRNDVVWKNSLGFAWIQEILSTRNTFTSQPGTHAQHIDSINTHTHAPLLHGSRSHVIYLTFFGLPNARLGFNVSPRSSCTEKLFSRQHIDSFFIRENSGVSRHLPGSRSHNMNAWCFCLDRSCESLATFPTWSVRDARQSRSTRSLETSAMSFSRAPACVLI